MKHILTLTVTLATLAAATPSIADTPKVNHTETRPLVSGDTHALNPQPIPPGHVRPLARSLDTHALNPQPIPPGHTALGSGPMNTQVKAPAGKPTPKAGWDITKNAKT